MSKFNSGMTRETYDHIVENIHTLELDLINGEILNRKSKSINGDGYRSIKLKGKCVLHHQVFAVALFGEKCIGSTVNHINRVRNDNRSINLELMSHSENARNVSWYVEVTNTDSGDKRIFESVRSAGRSLGICHANISNYLNGIRKGAGKYKFEKVEV